jgi:hypothetical protein
MDQNTFKVELALDKSIDNEYKFIVDGVWCYDVDSPWAKDEGKKKEREILLFITNLRVIILSF